MSRVPDFVDMVASMRRVQSPARARQILTHMRGRVADIERVGWPRLEASLKAELAAVEAVARERGFVR